MSARSVLTRRDHRRDAGVYGHTTTATYGMNTPPRAPLSLFLQQAYRRWETKRHRIERTLPWRESTLISRIVFGQTRGKGQGQEAGRQTKKTENANKQRQPKIKRKKTRWSNSKRVSLQRRGFHFTRLHCKGLHSKRLQPNGLFTATLAHFGNINANAQQYYCCL